MRKIYLISLLLFVSFGCSRKKDIPERCDFEVVHVTGGVTLGDFHNPINQMVASDSVLWVSSEHGVKSIMYAYSFDGNLLSTGVTYGRGPGEILELTSLHPLQKGRVALYDGRAGRLNLLSVNGTNIKSDILRDSLFLYDDAVILPGGRIVTLPVHSSVSYVLSDLDGDAIASLSYFPPKPKTIDENTHILACTGALAVAPDGKSMARAIAYDGGLDFFCIDDDRLSHKKRYSLFEMDYDALDGRVKLPIPNNNSRTGYSSLCSTDKYIYASYSEAKVLDNPDGECKEIHVFDYEGNPVCKLLLDRVFSSFTVTPEDNFVFVACDIDGKTFLIEYRLAEN